MKKTIAFALALFLAVAAAGFAQPYHIDFGNLPPDQAFRRRVEDFFKIYKYVNHWTPEWKYEISKEKAVGIMEALLKETGDKIAASPEENIDLALFHSLLRTCLYNLDAGNQYNIVSSELADLSARHPADYRPSWMLGAFYSHAGNCFDAIRRYHYIFEKVFTDGRMSTDVVEDYCAAALMALMPVRCLHMADQLAAVNNAADPTEAFPLYNQAKAQLKTPPVGTALPYDKVFLALEREHGAGFLCRLFGAWLPVKEEWSVKPLAVTEKGSGGMIMTVPLTSEKGRHIDVTILTLFQAQPRESFDEFLKKNLKRFKNAIPFQAGNLDWPLQVYEIRDSETYRENGGAHGFVAMLKRAEPKIKGLAVEHPSHFPRGDKTGAVYYQDKGGYTRFDGDMYYYFLLDSCEAVFDQSKAAFFEWLEGVLLD
ncbi:MAG: hypothetical protein JXD23_10270 [Spirochaetales bacterium]|nr:hypothetical protein [Spirochaetales bacterium]